MAEARFESALTMMILRSAPTSPFGRKIKIAAALLGLGATLSTVDTDTTSETDSIRRENPLGKVPTLILEDGSTLYDSRVVAEYLDHVAGGNTLHPADPAARFRALTLQALADGIMDASILQVYESRWRPADRHEPRWIAHQAGKVARGLTQLESAPPERPIDIGHVALACALGYFDLRFEGAWRDTFPKLVIWLERFDADVPAFAATGPKPA